MKNEKWKMQNEKCYEIIAAIVGCEGLSAAIANKKALIKNSRMIAIDRLRPFQVSIPHFHTLSQSITSNSVRRRVSVMV